MSKTRLCGYHAFVLKCASFFCAACLLISASGCEALVKKFTRKPKKENLPKEELVLAPEEYKAPVIPSEEAYRQYFLFWKSWQDELIDSLSLQSMNHKKQVSCSEEAIKNLGQLKSFLKDGKQDKMDKYIARLTSLRNDIAKDVYGVNVVSNRQTAELLKSEIMRDLSINKIKGDLK
ncbi:MAG: hypothetical protein PHN57_03505 [Candidatus Omnitrophica bacterium]|nr:hypothetical protein [Candidatus Omnitrophota bacterium]